MERSEGVDDQGSGWMQVKKKHRSNSKFSLHGCVGGIYVKHNSSNPSNRLSPGQRIDNSTSVIHPSNISSDAVNSITIPPKDEAADHYLDKCVVNQDKEDFDSSQLASAVDSNSSVLPKIKWGDLDEGTLTHFGKTSGSGITFGGIENHNLASMKAGENHDPKQDEYDGAAIEEDQDLPKSHSSSPKGIRVKENFEEVNEVSSEDVKEQITSDKEIVYAADEVTIMGETSNVTSESACLPLGETTQYSEPVTLREESSIVEEPKDQNHEISSDCLSSTHNTEANIDSDVTGESKERFRERLWCFLFENLHRAVDELYLLCELECDLDQMKEASLVLEEAAFDFKELKSRVENFEKSKRSASLSNDGSPSTLPSDHRRPHALSWEVRRMTTSPRRAEILSSSLEAFRKIQQERTSERANNTEKLVTLENRDKRGDLLPDSKEPTSKTTRKEKRNPDSSKTGDKPFQKKEPILERKTKSTDPPKRNIPLPEKEGEKRISSSGRSMDAWKEKRNWEDVLSSPHRVSSRKSTDRARILHDKLMSPEKKKKSAVDLKKEAEEKHARATRIRTQLESERVQKLQRTSEKLTRVNEWQTVRSNKLRESMFARHRLTESRHEAHLAQVVRRAGDESKKVNEVRFITSLNEEDKKHILHKKLQDSQLRRAEKYQVMKTKQKEDTAREEAVLERRKIIESEKLQRLVETQRKKEEAQARWEEERKASSAAREAKFIEQRRKKEDRVKARKEEAELMAQKLAERLSESEQRRKFHLEQIRERASMDFRDQSSPLLRRYAAKESRANLGEENQDNYGGRAAADSGALASEHSQKRRIKRIRQRLMSLKHEFPEVLGGSESSGIGYRTALGTVKGKIGRWVQDLQKLRQARKDGAANFGLITAEMIKFLEGKDLELQASRQAGLIDFIASALPASHTSKPKTCQVTISLLRLLKVVLSIPANKCYFLVQNLLPPIIPMLAAALENYIKLAAINFISSKTPIENLELISEIVDGFLWIVSAVISHISCNEQQLQMQDGLVELVLEYQIIHRLRDLFALYDRPQVEEGSPFPSSILLSINLLAVLTSKFRETTSSIDWESFSSESLDLRSTLNDGLPHVPEGSQSLSTLSDNKCEYSLNQKDGDNSAEPNNGNGSESKRPSKFLLSAISETGLVCLPSTLTAVLLQANNRMSAEQSSYVLPSNFEEVATGVLKFLNNLAQIDVTFIQNMLARPDLKMEFFHLMSFLLSHCTSNWGAVTDKIGLLLLESLSLLGYFALFHPGNQAVLRWGKSPTILHKVCDLPFVFFSDPDLMPILACTLVLASYRCEQNKRVIQQELSTEMLLPLLKSCKANLPSVQNGPPLVDDSKEPDRTGSDRKDSQKSNRSGLKNTRAGPVRGGLAGNGATRTVKGRNQRDSKVIKISEELGFGYSQSTSEVSSLMLQFRFPASFIIKAEQFFREEITLNGEFSDFKN